MQTVRELVGLRHLVAQWRSAGERVALVPTMGALHDGHLALVEAARKRAERVLVSIFVNPLQFNDKADLDRYPRDEAADLAKLATVGTDLVWAPNVEDLYPDGFATTVHVGGISDRWEGEHRPGHFDGVATVVAKLLIAVMPDVALFGEKDFQQLALIRRLATDLGLAIAIEGVPTVRADDGLALSSRNVLLTGEQRSAAVALPRALGTAASAIARGGDVRSALKEVGAALHTAGYGPIDYVAYVDGSSLEPLDHYRPGGRILAAAFLGKIRLIDNICVVSDT